MFLKKKKANKTELYSLQVSGQPLPKSGFWELSSRPGAYQPAWLQETGLEDCGLECVNVKIRHCSFFSVTTTRLWFGPSLCWVFWCWLISCFAARSELLRGSGCLGSILFVTSALPRLTMPRRT